jgi:hypothetical protein
MGQIVPWLGTLTALAGVAYSIYLLHLGLPRTMGCPPERAAAYTAVSIRAAQGEALGAMMGAAMGGGTVEALAPEKLRAFVPETLAGLPRTTLSVERNGAAGLQIV